MQTGKLQKIPYSIHTYKYLSIAFLKLLDKTNLQDQAFFKETSQHEQTFERSYIFKKYIHTFPLHVKKGKL